MTNTEISIYDKIANCETRAQRKELLKQLSKQAKALIDLGDERNVNTIIIDSFKNETHQEFNNFWQWKKLGFKVKKGEKAFFVWSKKQKGIETNKETNEEEEFSFFSIAYLFSNAQVEPIKSSGDA